MKYILFLLVSVFAGSQVFAGSLNYPTPKRRPNPNPPPFYSCDVTEVNTFLSESSEFVNSNLPNISKMSKDELGTLEDKVLNNLQSMHRIEGLNCGFESEDLQILGKATTELFELSDWIIFFRNH